MADETRGGVIELEVTPYPPETVAAIRKKLVQDLEAALREKGYEEQLRDGSIQINLSQNTGIETALIYAAIQVAQNAATMGAAGVIYGVIIPKLRERYGIKEKAYSPGKLSGADSTSETSHDADTNGTASASGDEG